MKTSPGFMDRAELEQAATKAEVAAKHVRGLVITMETLGRKRLYIKNAGALDEGITRLTTFATSAARAMNEEDGPEAGPDSKKPAPKTRKKT